MWPVNPQRACSFTVHDGFDEVVRSLDIWWREQSPHATGHTGLSWISIVRDSGSQEFSFKLLIVLTFFLIADVPVAVVVVWSFTEVRQTVQSLRSKNSSGFLAAFTMRQRRCHSSTVGSTSNTLHFLSIMIVVLRLHWLGPSALIQLSFALWMRRLNPFRQYAGRILKTRKLSPRQETLRESCAAAVVTRRQRICSLYRHILHSGREGELAPPTVPLPATLCTYLPSTKSETTVIYRC